MVGAASGNAVAWLMNWVIPYIYDEATLGLASAIIAVAAACVGPSTMRLEVLTQRVSDDSRAKHLLRAGLGTTFWYSVAITVVAGLAVLGGAPAAWLGVGALVALGSLQMLGAAVLTRSRQYKRLAITSFSQAVGLGSLQALFGLISAQVVSLMAGFALCRLVWLRTLKGVWRFPMRPLASLTGEERRFSLVAGGSALVNSGATQLPIPMVALLLSQAEAGEFSMATRVLAAPIAVMSQAVAAATIGEIGARVRAHQVWWPTVRKSVLALFGIGAVVCGAAAAFGLFVVDYILPSSGWQQVGPLIAALAIGSWFQFGVSPFSQLLNLTGQHASLLTWDLSRLVLITASFIVPWLAGASLLVIVLCYSTAMCVLYLFLLGLIRRAARDPLSPSEVSSNRPAG